MAAPPAEVTVTTLAGLKGTQGALDGTGTATRFNNPRGIAVTPDHPSQMFCHRFAPRKCFVANSPFAKRLSTNSPSQKDRSSRSITQKNTIYRSTSYLGPLITCHSSSVSRRPLGLVTKVVFYPLSFFVVSHRLHRCHLRGIALSLTLGIMRYAALLAHSQEH